MAVIGENVCYFFKFGFCKYVDKCKYKHEKKICKIENCEIENCASRHPKSCRYFKEFGMCKFGDYCLFNHNVNRKTPESEVQILKEKIETLEKIIDDKGEDFEEVKRNERAQDDQIVNLQKDLREKDRVINDIKSEIESIAKAVLKYSSQKTLQPLNCSTNSISSPSSRNLMTTSKPIVTECCPHRCCSGSYAPARNCPGPGHARKPDDATVCHNHKKKS